MKNLAITTITIVTLAFGTIFFAGHSYASYGSVGCTPIYGGGQSCESANKFVLDKKVLNPTSTKGGVNEFVDNLSINDSKYGPNQIVKFELTVTNTGEKSLDKLTLTDILPSYVTFVSGPGAYNTNNNTLTILVKDLNPDESRKYIIEAKIKAAKSLPSDKAIICVVNQASLTKDNDESRDNSQFCIEKTVTTKGGLPVMPAPRMEKTPSTGAEALSLLALLPAGAAGIFLRRRSK